MNDFNRYLSNLESSPVRTVKELIDFNTERADQELPPGEPKNRSKGNPFADDLQAISARRGSNLHTSSIYRMMNTKPILSTCVTPLGTGA